MHTDSSEEPCPPPRPKRKSSEFKGQGFQQYHTWQRGMKAVALHKQFPMLYQEVDKTPLMYDMMVPHLPSRHADTPFTELQSSTSSLHPAVQIPSN